MLNPFQVFVDDDPLPVMRPDLESAKTLAREHIEAGARDVRIEFDQLPAPTRIWRFDHQIRDFVETH